MRIIVREDRQAVRGDFDAQADHQGLALPLGVAGALAKLGVGTAEELLAYVGTFPSAVASVLRWDVDDVEHARHKLVSQLRGFVDERLLSPDPPEHRVLGAFDPKSIPGK